MDIAIPHRLSENEPPKEVLSLLENPEMKKVLITVSGGTLNVHQAVRLLVFRDIPNFNENDLEDIKDSLCGISSQCSELLTNTVC